MWESFSLPILLFPLFFLVALLYSSVGHGGATGYLALFALFGITNPKIAPIALVLNIFVAGVSFLIFRQSGYFRFGVLLPFVVTSIPFAYLGASLKVSTGIFSIILAILLFLAALRILLPKVATPVRKVNNPLSLWLYGIVIGAVLGFFSGMIGIGGGVFLSPVILLLGIADMRETASVSAGFIVLNSLSGLFSHLARGNVLLAPTLSLGAVVLLGALLGSFLGARRISPRLLQIPLSLVLLVASFKLFLTAIR